MTVKATVEVIEGKASRVVSIPRAGLSLGRGPDQGVQLASRSVSAAHVELFWQGDDLFLRDAGSSFGTRRDGRDLAQPSRIVDGDEVVLGGSVVLRFAIADAGFGAPLSALSENDEGEVATEVPEDAAPAAIDLLPLVHSFYQAVSVEDLAHRLVAAAVEEFRPSRVALLDLEGSSERFRVLAVAGLAEPAAAFVSRSLVTEAARRGVARYALDAPARPAHGSLIRAGASSAIAAGVRPQDGRVRVLYLDSLVDSAPLTWSHALSLQLFAAHAGAAFDAVRARRRFAEDQRRFQQLRRYFSPAVADHILRGRLDAVDRPQRLYATVLFADLVAYTKLSERLSDDPDRLLSVLNGWLDAGASAVIDQGGTLDKFIGDAVMAVFGAPFPMPEGELLAVRCALQMRDALAAVCRETGEPLQITVGVNSGHVVAGSVGSKRRLEYTVLGDTVNVASRLQGQCRPGEILVGAATADKLGGAVELEDAGELPIKNHGPVRAYRVLRLRV